MRTYQYEISIQSNNIKLAYVQTLFIFFLLRASVLLRGLYMPPKRIGVKGSGGFSWVKSKNTGYKKKILRRHRRSKFIKYSSESSPEKPREPKRRRLLFDEPAGPSTSVTFPTSVSKLIQK